MTGIEKRKFDKFMDGAATTSVSAEMCARDLELMCIKADIKPSEFVAHNRAMLFNTQFEEEAEFAYKQFIINTAKHEVYKALNELLTELGLYE